MTEGRHTITRVCVESYKKKIPQGYSRTPHLTGMAMLVRYSVARCFFRLRPPCSDAAVCVLQLGEPREEFPSPL